MEDIRKAFEESGIAKKWGELWDRVKKIFFRVRDEFMPKWDAFWKYLQTIADIVRPRIEKNIQDIVDKLEKIAPNLPPIGTIFSVVFGIMGAVATFWGAQITAVMNGISTAIEYIGIVIETFKPFWTWLSDSWKDASWIEKVGLVIAATAAAIFEAFSIVLYGVAGYVKGWVLGIIGFFTDLYNKLVGQSIVPEMMKAIYNTITTIFQNVLTWIGAKLTELATAFSTKATEIKAALAAAWAEIQATATTIWTDITTALATKAQEIYDAVSTKVTELQTWWGTTWGSIRDALGGIWTEITTAATTKIAEVVTAVAGGVQDTLDAVATFVTKFYTAGSDLIGGMVQGVLDAIAGLIAAVVKAIKDALDAARDFLEAFSPSKKTMRLGFDFVEGFRLPIEMEGAALIGTLDRALKPLLGGMARLPDMSARAALAPAPVLGGGSTTNNYYNSNAFDFGRNQVASPADLARMEMMVTRVVRKELRRR
jgi:phage-related protein